MVRQSDSGLEGLGSIPRNGGFSFDWALTKGLKILERRSLHDNFL